MQLNLLFEHNLQSCPILRSILLRIRLKKSIKDNRCIRSVLEITKSVIKDLTIIPKITGTVTAKNILIEICSIDISFVISITRKPAEL